MAYKEVENEWDLENLYADLASEKGRNLTPTEKLHLRGLLCGCSPSEIAEKLNKKVNGIEVDFSNTIYQYVKNLVNKSDEKLDNWRNIRSWLEEAGYKNCEIVKTQSNQLKDLNAKVHISTIHIENQVIEIGVLIQLVLPSDSSEEN